MCASALGRNLFVVSPRVLFRYMFTRTRVCVYSCAHTRGNGSVVLVRRGTSARIVWICFPSAGLAAGSLAFSRPRGTPFRPPSPASSVPPQLLTELSPRAVAGRARSRRASAFKPPPPSCIIYSRRGETGVPRVLGTAAVRRRLFLTALIGSSSTLDLK